MKFVSFEDTTGLHKAVFFPKAYQRFCHMLNEMEPYILKDKVEEDFTVVTFTAKRIDCLGKYNQVAYSVNFVVA
jgi:DNA polymerase III alpha subunit